MKFTKAKQNRIFQDIVDQIEEAILDGQVKPDERLPAERELCEQFKASRGTLREALRILEQKGLIEIRLGAGGGAFVRDSKSELMAENLAMLIRSNKAIPIHLLELREEMVACVATLAAKRASTDDIEILKSLVLRAQQHKDNGTDGWEQFAQVEEILQQEINRIADNPIYEFLLQSIYDNLDRFFHRNTEQDADKLNEKFQNLRMMVYAIGKNDESLAAHQARDHVLRFSTYTEQRKQ